MAKLLFPVPELWLGAIWVCEVGLAAPVWTKRPRPAMEACSGSMLP